MEINYEIRYEDMSMYKIIAQVQAIEPCPMLVNNQQPMQKDTEIMVLATKM